MSTTSQLLTLINDLLGSGSDIVTKAEHKPVLEAIANSLLNKETDANLLGLLNHDPTRTYSEGEGVFKDGELYRANQNIAIEAFNPSKWDQITGNTSIVDYNLPEWENDFPGGLGTGYSQDFQVVRDERIFSSDSDSNTQDPLVGGWTELSASAGLYGVDWTAGLYKQFNTVTNPVDRQLYYLNVDTSGSNYTSLDLSAEIIAGDWLPVYDVASFLKNEDLIFSTGVNEGGVISINGGDNTKFDISDGSGVIVDEWTTPGTPIVHKISWSGLTSQTVTNLATSTVSFIFLDQNGDVFQSTSAPDPITERDYIYIGQLGHSNNTSIQSANSEIRASQSTISQLRDLQRAIGGINEGNIISANGANLSINKSEGDIVSIGLNFENNPKNPNILVFPSQTLATIRRRTQDGGSGTSTTLDVLNYDLNGVVTSISGTKCQNQRVYLLTSGNIVVQYGQQLYNSLSEAIQGISTENFIELENVKNGILIAIISVQNNCTSLQNTTRSRIGNTGKFSQVSTTFGGTSVSTLQQAYNNSTTPEIITDSTRGAVTIKRGSAADSDDVFEVLNGAGTKTAAITGEGKGILTGGTLTGTLELEETELEFTIANGPFAGSVGQLVGQNITASRSWELPDQSGLIALTSDIAAAVTGVAVLQGGYNAATNTPDLDTSPSGISKGFMYLVTVAGTFFTEDVDVGDTLIANVDNPTTLADWIRLEKNNDYTLANVLALDNNTGGNDIIVSSGDVIKAAANLILRAGSGGYVELQPNNKTDYSQSWYYGSSVVSQIGFGITGGASGTSFRAAEGSARTIIDNITIVDVNEDGQVITGYTNSKSTGVLIDAFATTTGIIDLDNNPLIDGAYKKVTATGNITLNATTLEPTTYSKRWSLEFTQDATGGRTLTLGTNFLTPGGVAPEVSLGANQSDTIIFETDSSGKHRLVEHRKSYA